jgi:hypothetical protein
VSNRQRARPIRRRPGDYLGHLVATYQRGEIPAIPGTVGIVTILHDAECRRPDGGTCTCVAELGELTYPRLAKERAR